MDGDIEVTVVCTISSPPPPPPPKPETDIPQTGDSSNVMMWVMIALASGLGLLFVIKKTDTKKPSSKKR